MKIIQNIVLTLAFALTGVACLPTSEQVNADFDAALADTKDCSQDSDCVVIFPGCPLGCHVAVHQDDAEELEQTADNLIAAHNVLIGGECAYSCLPHDEPTCEENRCVVVSVDLAEDTLE